jgi:hypothetical protein
MGPSRASVPAPAEVGFVDGASFPNNTCEEIAQGVGMVGDFKSGGRELRREGGSQAGASMISRSKAANQGWFNVGNDADAAEFAVESIPRHTFQGDYRYTISPKQQGPL